MLWQILSGRVGFRGWRECPPRRQGEGVMRAVRGVIVAAASISMLALSPALAHAGDDPQPVDFTHNVVDAPAPVAGAVFGNGPTVKTGTAICTPRSWT